MDELFEVDILLKIEVTTQGEQISEVASKSDTIPPNFVLDKNWTVYGLDGDGKFYFPI